MPTVPTLEQPSVGAEPLPGRPFPRISDEVSPAAFGTPVARGLEDISGVMSSEQARQKVQNDNLRVIDANTQLEAGRNALLYGRADENGVRQGGAFSLHGTDAINLPAKLLPEYQKLADNISSGLTPDQQRIFHGHIAASSNELNLQLNRYEYEESNRLSNEVYKNGASQAIESASVGWRDPIVVGKSRADIKALVQLQGDRDGWPQSDRDAQTQKLLAELHYSVVDRMLADGQPQAALRYFVGTKSEPGIRDSRELSGEQAHQLGAAIDAAVRQQGAQLQTDVAAKIRDVRSAAINGQLIPPSAMPSDATLRAAFPDTWQELKNGVARDIQMGADLKSFATLAPAELAQHVEGYRPSGVAGAAEGYERFNAAAAAAQRTVADRAKDPRQYAIDNNLGSKPLDFTDPQKTGDELRARLASTATLSRQIGGYVPPLTRDEATRLAQSFESMTPADRLRSLGSLNASLKDDRGFQALMHQVLPGSPVTAIVGGQLSASQPHEAPVWFDHRFAADPADQVRILAGEQLLNPQGLEKGEEGGRKGGKAFPMPHDEGASGLREQFANRAGKLFRTRPELSEDYFQAFKGAYAQLLAEKGDLSGNGSGKLRDQALSMVLGHLVDFNGQEVAVPPGMDPSRFQGLLRNAVTGRARAAGAPEGFEDKIRGYQLREIGALGSGQYELVSGNAPLVNPGARMPATAQLSPEQEIAYRGWLNRIGMTREKGFNVDENFTGRDYDLRGFFKKYGAAAVDVTGGQHFTDEFKLPNHATFSDQSQYASGAMRQFAGHWEGSTFVPPAARFSQAPQAFTVDLVGQYLPGVAHGSPEDIARAAKEGPPAQPAGAPIEPGEASVPKPTPTEKAIKAPALATGRGRGKARPSQGEPPEL